MFLLQVRYTNICFCVQCWNCDQTLEEASELYAERNSTVKYHETINVNDANIIQTTQLISTYLGKIWYNLFSFDFEYSTESQQNGLASPWNWSRDHITVGFQATIAIQLYTRWQCSRVRVR